MALPIIYACDLDFAPVLGCPIICNRSMLPHNLKVVQVLLETPHGILLLFLTSLCFVPTLKKNQGRIVRVWDKSPQNLGEPSSSSDLVVSSVIYCS